MLVSERHWREAGGAFGEVGVVVPLRRCEHALVLVRSHTVLNGIEWLTVGVRTHHHLLERSLNLLEFFTLLIHIRLYVLDESFGFCDCFLLLNVQLSTPICRGILPVFVKVIILFIHFEK